MTALVTKALIMICNQCSAHARRDKDMKAKPGQEGGPSLSIGELHMLSREVLAMCKWGTRRSAIHCTWLPMLRTAADDTDTVQTVV